MKMRHLKQVATGDLWGFDETQDDLYDAKLASGEFAEVSEEEVAAIQNPPRTADEIRASFEGDAQLMLDQVAQAWGYDSISRAITYLNSTVPQWKADAVALNLYRDQVWQAAHQIDVDVTAGRAVAPVDSVDFIDRLPVAPSQPVVS